jgi:hypothetical protein
MLVNTFNDLLPFRQLDEHDVINFYSLDNTGVGGRFVTILTGNQDPALSAGDFAASTPGYAYDHTVALRYEQPRKVKVSASGDTVGAVIGLSLNGTIEHDENGQKVLFHKEVQNEKQIVPSGMTIPIATAGIFTLSSRAYTNTPIPGYVGVIAGDGKVAFVPGSAAIYGSGLAVCKVLSSSGSAFGGYAQIKLL